MKPQRLKLINLASYGGISIVLIMFVANHQLAQEANNEGVTRSSVRIEKNQIVDASVCPEPKDSFDRSSTEEKAGTGRPDIFAAAMQRFEHMLVRNTPMSAQVMVEIVWPGRNGDTATRQTIYAIYRDSDGRTRRDLMSEKASPANDPILSIITDPSNRMSFISNHRSKTVRQLTDVTESNEREASKTSSATTPRGTPTGFVSIGAETRKKQSKDLSGSRASLQKEFLGQREVEGVMAEGSRMVQSVNQGAFGPGRTVEITTEEWYSPELHAVVLITYDDPRFGKSEYRLTNIERSEPARTLFSVPQNYKRTDR